MNPNQHHHDHLFKPQSPPPPSSPYSFSDMFPTRMYNFRQDHIHHPPSFSLDQTLYDSLSSLKITPQVDHDRRNLIPASFENCGDGGIAGDSRFKVFNGLGFDQSQYYDVGQCSFLKMGPHVQDRGSSSLLSSQFDFDQMGYLKSKEQQYYYYYRQNGKKEMGFGCLRELRGKICVMAKDQNGYKYLLSKFERPTKEEVDIVVSEVVGSFADLMTDQYGNYLIQKLVCVCDEEQKGVIVSELTERSVDIVIVCMSQYGTRAVQKLLENLTSRNQLMRVIRALQRFAVQLANDANGHHVLQFCLLHFDCDFNQPILNTIAENCFKVATDRSGCCLLQACVEHSRGEVRSLLIAEIMVNALQIAEDPFGNYVLQHMVGLKSPKLTRLLVSQLQGNFAYLSQNKYASNVVERCLIESEPDIASIIILELVESPNAPSLLVDPYGNFVIQSALKVSKGFVFDCLRKLISTNVNSMQTNLYGKKILEKMEKRRIIHS